MFKDSEILTNSSVYFKIIYELKTLFLAWSYCLLIKTVSVISTSKPLWAVIGFPTYCWTLLWIHHTITEICYQIILRWCPRTDPGIISNSYIPVFYLWWARINYWCVTNLEHIKLLEFFPLESSCQAVKTHSSSRTKWNTRIGVRLPVKPNKHEESPSPDLIRTPKFSLIWNLVIVNQTANSLDPAQRGKEKMKWEAGWRVRIWFLKLFEAGRGEAMFLYSKGDCPFNRAANSFNQPKKESKKSIQFLSSFSLFFFEQDQNYLQLD